MRKIEPRPQTLVERAISTISPSYRMGNLRARWAEALGDSMFKNSHGSASKTRVDTSWTTPGQGTIKRIAGSKQRKIRARAQELDRENALFSALLNRTVDFSVGKGFFLQAGTDDEEWNTRAEELWRNYWQNPEVTGLTGLEVERYAFRSWHRDGDAGAILISDGRIQLVEGGQLQDPRDKMNDDRFYDGVEVNDAFRPVRFHLSVRSQDSTRKRDQSTEGVDARDFVWLTRLKRHIDVRGTPALASSFNLFDQIDGYVEAAIIAARMAACFGIISQRKNPAQGFGNLAQQTNSEGDSVPTINMEPGIFEYITDSESFSQVKPEQPGQQFEPIIRQLVRMASIEMGFPLEIALLDFSTSNYSRAKAAMNQAVRSAEPWQAIFTQRFMSRIYRWKVSKWMKEGRLPQRDDAWKHRFTPYPFAFLDPIKDMQGKMLEVDAGYATEDDHIISLGRDPKQVRERRARELADKRDKQIPVMRGSTAFPVTVEQQVGFGADEEGAGAGELLNTDEDE